MNLRTTFLCLGVAISVFVAARAVPGSAQVPVPQGPVQPQMPGQPQPTPSQGVDPRVAQLKAALERQGIRASEVGVTPARSSGPGLWYATTPAAYAQPSIAACFKQAMDVWWVMYNVVGQDPPEKFMVNAQAWNRYEIQVIIRIGEYRDFLSRYRAAQSDAQRNDAFQSVLNKVGIRVWDLEQRRFVDEDDFINKNFD